MDNNILFSKNKNELLYKINIIINDDQIKIEYRECFKKWINWYEKNEESIKLVNLEGTNKFYRAYYNEGIYGIQIWELREDNLIFWHRNLYVSEPDVLDDTSTVIINESDS